MRLKTKSAIIIRSAESASIRQRAPGEKKRSTDKLNIDSHMLQLEMTREGTWGSGLFEMSLEEQFSNLTTRVQASTVPG